MKTRTRLALLVLALAMSSLAVSGAFAKGGGGRLSPKPGKSIRAMADYTIYCLDGRTTPCSGSYDYCVGYCDGYCGGGPGSCA